MSTDNPYPGVDASLEEREAWEARENEKYADLDKVFTEHKQWDLGIEGGTVSVPTDDEWSKLPANLNLGMPKPRYVCEYDINQRPNTHWRRRLTRKFQGTPLRVQFLTAEYRWRSDAFVVTLLVYQR